MKKENIVRHTVDEIGVMTSQTDWVKAHSMTEAQLEASIAADPDEAGMVIDWESATIEMPKTKAHLNMRVDRDVLDYFRQTGRGYQTRINAVLRSYVEQLQRHNE